MTVEPETASAPTGPSGVLWAERVGAGRYDGFNERGAAVRMGPADLAEAFTPGELLEIALAGCVGMSADHILARRLGTDVPVSVRVSGTHEPQERRYSSIHEELIVDLSGLDATEREQVVTVVRRAVERYCRVGRTIKHSASTELTIVDAP